MNFPAGWRLPEKIKERLGETAGRQRAIVEGEHLLLVLHKLPTDDSYKRDAALFWRQPNGEWKSSDGREGIGTVRTHLDAYVKALQNLEDDYEKANSATEHFCVLEAIVPISRAAKNQAATLQAARDALPDALDIITLRDIASDIERGTEIVHADAKNALDYKIARQAEEQSRLGNELSEAGNRLNLLAALFLPMSVIGAAFGSSLKSGLEESGPWLFWALLCGALMIGFLLRGKPPRK